ncbi:MAG: hypothetical protein ACOC85_05980 [Thermoplasmatota archaeon]
METNWDRIKRELDSLNLFYSAVTGRSDVNNGFQGLGFDDYIQITLKDRYSEGSEARPDFILLKDDYMCIVEVKSGRNIDDQDVKQSSRNSSFSIEGLRNYFRDYHDMHVEIKEFDSVFVYYQDHLEECMKYDNCKEKIEEVMADSVVLSQKKGGDLTYWRGSKNVNSSSLDEALKKGITLDETPKNEIMLVDDPEIENIVVYLIRRFIDGLKNKNEIILSHRDIHQEYIPKNKYCQLDRVKNAMETIRKCGGATLKQGTSKYRVKKSDVAKLMSIPDTLSEKDANDILDIDSENLESFDKSS